MNNEIQTISIDSNLYNKDYDDIDFDIPDDFKDTSNKEAEIKYGI